MATEVDSPTAPASAPARSYAPDVTPTPPVKIWAGFGAAIVLFIAYVLIRWVTGPYFTPVTAPGAGPPVWMKTELVVWQAISIPIALLLIYRCVVRPWRRERTIGIDGLLVIAFATLWFQDPLSSSGGTWLVYNSWMVNFGSWTASVPWWSAFARPGAMIAEPVLFIAAAYVYCMLWAAMLGCWVMRRAQRRRPQLRSAGLVAVCYVVMCCFDVLCEGIIWMPQGAFEFPGGRWAIFPSHYFKYPLNEMFTVGAVFTVFACLRFFLDDRGHSRAERGIDDVTGSPRRKLAIRALAVTAAVQISFFVLYSAPNTLVGSDSTAWPAALQKRPYLLDNLCGPGTDRYCPGPTVPDIRLRSSYPNTHGRVTPAPGRAGTAR